MAQIRKREGKTGVRYMAVVRRDGHQRTATFKTKSEAKDWASVTESKILQGIHLPWRESGERTVDDMMSRYIEYEIPKKKDQANPLRHAKLWKDRLGKVRLNALTSALIVRIRDELSSDRSPATVNRYLAVLSHACSLAEREWGWIGANPVRSVGRLKEATGRVRYLSIEEKSKLIKAVQRLEHPYLDVVVYMALTTGARRGEILGLRWKNVSLERRTALIEDSKNGDRRTISLVEPVVSRLRELKAVQNEKSEFVFANSKTAKPSYFQIEKAWRQARKQAGLEDFRFHDLRHTWASYAAMNGATTAEIAAVLGHKTLVMVKRYSHLSDEHVRDVIERMAPKLLGEEVSEDE